jgi:hypothetical protein
MEKVPRRGGPLYARYQGTSPVCAMPQERMAEGRQGLSAIAMRLAG